MKYSKLKVKCIDNTEGHFHVTEGKEYRLEDFDAKFYWVLSDENEIIRYFKKVFKEIEYTLQEIFNKPIGSMFTVVYENKKSDKSNIKSVKRNDSIIQFQWESGKDVVMTNCMIKAKFFIVEQPKPVSFMEVVNSDRKCRVEHEEYNCPKGYLDFDNMLLELGKENTIEGYKSIIKEGKWFLES